MARQHPNILKIKKRRHKERRYYIDSKFNGIHVPRTVGQTAKPELLQAVGFVQRFNKPDPAFLQAMFPNDPGMQALARSYIEAEDKLQARRVEQALSTTGNGTFKRRYALDRAEQLRVEALLEHEEAHNCITVKDSRLLCSRLTFLHNSRYTHCYFIETFYRDNGGSYMMKSIVYEGRERAYWMMHHPTQIAWVEHLPLPSLIPVLPRPETSD